MPVVLGAGREAFPQAVRKAEGKLALAGSGLGQLAEQRLKQVYVMAAVLLEPQPHVVRRIRGQILLGSIRSVILISVEKERSEPVLIEVLTICDGISVRRLVPTSQPCGRLGVVGLPIDDPLTFVHDASLTCRHVITHDGKCQQVTATDR